MTRLSLYLAIALLTAAGAQATTLTLKPDGSGDAPTIADAMTIVASGDTILLECGTYFEHGVSMTKGVTLRSVTGMADCVTIDAQQIERVFSCINPDSVTRLEGLTITNGNAAGAYPDFIGGAINIILADTGPVFRRCVFSNNHADANGGAIMGGGSGTPTFYDCEFISNTADNLGGAALAGWTVFNGSACSLRFVRCTFEGNSAHAGGAISQEGMGTTTFQDCDFTGNLAFAYGAVYCARDTSVMISGCSFVQNVDSTSAGAISLWNADNAQIVGSTFFQNTSWSPGGSGALRADSCDVLTIDNCTLVKNVSNAGTIRLNASPSPTISHTIIAFNVIARAIECGDPPSLPQLSCSDLFLNWGGDYVHCVTGLEGVDGNFSAHPLFCDLEAGDLTLVNGSPCLAANSPCGALVGAHDQGCDVGTGIAGGPIRPKRLEIEAVHPNPFTTHATIDFALPVAGYVRVDVFDAAGRRVRRVMGEMRGAGPNQVTWDGRDEGGVKVASGVYFARVWAGTTQRTRKLILVR